MFIFYSIHFVSLVLATLKIFSTLEINSQVEAQACIMQEDHQVEASLSISQNKQPNKKQSPEKSRLVLFKLQLLFVTYDI